jgi:class 3 adenylate cyclase/pimeloyl-ACP methyl ester carboxylesterase
MACAWSAQRGSSRCQTESVEGESEIRYAKSDGLHIAYQVMGQGPIDVLLMTGEFISIDAWDEWPDHERAMRRLASFSRLIRFDKRGIGLSDPISADAPPTLEQWMRDALAVLDAAGCGCAVVMGCSDAATVAVLLAGAHPERVISLALVNGYARFGAASDYPEGASADDIASLIDDTVEPGGEGGFDVATMAPSVAGDVEFQRWWGRVGQRCASPATARALLGVYLTADVREVLPQLRVPTLVLHREDDRAVPVALGGYLAAHIPNARWMQLPGADDVFWLGDTDGLLDEIEEFITGVRAAPTTNRVLSSVLFTDIVASTEVVAEVGDKRWSELLDRHNAAIRRQLNRFRGTEVNTTGDGFVATFDGPASAVTCACAIRDATRQLGLEVRSGVHTGEIELCGDDISGIGVHIAARVAAAAEPSTVWVSRIVTDLVTGSGLQFVHCGTQHLKGLPGAWDLYAVADD